MNAGRRPAEVALLASLATTYYTFLSFSGTDDATDRLLALAR